MVAKGGEVQYNDDYWMMADFSLEEQNQEKVIVHFIHIL